MKSIMFREGNAISYSSNEKGFCSIKVIRIPEGYFDETIKYRFS